MHPAHPKPSRPVLGDCSLPPSKTDQNGQDNSAKPSLLKQDPQADRPSDSAITCRPVRELTQTGSQGLDSSSGVSSSHLHGRDGQKDSAPPVPDNKAKSHWPGRVHHNPLHYAINMGDKKAVDRLLQEGADLTATDKLRQTPQHQTCLLYTSDAADE